MRAASSAIAAEMIAVPVRRDQVVDLREAGVLDRGHDAVGVARRRPAPPLPVSISSDSPDGDDEQRRVAALDVDDVDVQRRPAARLRVGERRADETAPGTRP